jgi:hypothetical protein
VLIKNEMVQLFQINESPMKIQWNVGYTAIDQAPLKLIASLRRSGSGRLLGNLNGKTGNKLSKLIPFPRSFKNSNFLSH